MAITTRETTATGVVNKDAPLTNAELDQNFIELKQGKSDVGHGHTWGNISGAPATATRWPTWSEVTSKPSTFAPSAHTHTIANVTGLQTALDGKSATSHNHTLNSLSNVTITSNASGEILKWNGTAWVNNTLAEAGIAASSHNHSWSNITSGVPATATRWPTWSEVTSKPSTFAPSAHGHAVGDISGLGSLATINTNASTTNYLRGDGTWVALPASATRGEITITNLNNAASTTLGFISGRRMQAALNTFAAESLADVATSNNYNDLDNKPDYQTQIDKIRILALVGI